MPRMPMESLMRRVEVDEQDLDDEARERLNIRSRRYYHAMFGMGSSGRGIKGCPLGRGSSSEEAIRDLMMRSNTELMEGFARIRRDDLNVEVRELP